MEDVTALLVQVTALSAKYLVFIRKVKAHCNGKDWEGKGMNANFYSKNIRMLQDRPVLSAQVTDKLYNGKKVTPQISGLGMSLNTEIYVRKKISWQFLMCFIRTLQRYRSSKLISLGISDNSLMNADVTALSVCLPAQVDSVAILDLSGRVFSLAFLGD